MTLKEAKEIYWKNGCSAFFLARGEERYQELSDMHIPRQTLEQWATEYLEKCIAKITKKETWDSFSTAVLIVGEHRTIENLKLFYEMLRNLHFKDELSKYAVCHSLLGMRNTNIKCGILDYAKDSKDSELYREMLEYTKSLLNNMQVDDDKKNIAEQMKDLIRYYH
ncbi:hypothetical protein [Butyrivibrio proteoclasticus]|uniref:hypothetical protein n=1 Tax=Butyrivibrio proteoclasticus TaxID=43305 RepID=UPI00047DB60B|nr:hypothetical protein [Butyrivibrio proteoclasticus]